MQPNDPQSSLYAEIYSEVYVKSMRFQQPDTDKFLLFTTKFSSPVTFVPLQLNRETQSDKFGKYSVFQSTYKHMNIVLRTDWDLISVLAMASCFSKWDCRLSITGGQVYERMSLNGVVDRV